MPDQLTPLEERVDSLGLQLHEESGDRQVVSPRISLKRHLAASDSDTFWLNGNHMAIGAMGGADGKLPFVLKFASGEVRSPTKREMVSIATSYWRESCFFEWQLGDLLLFDNQLMAHNATPAVGARRILPCFGDAF